ncbi:MAG: thymidine phosphorylase [Proteobacteria bacterium]|nr:MAG: thymidine phosphorylase [Pseudomonadota bacterium]PIE17693.1 MAG: thymidine phosphorylase [Pseudomonadota bacterium]
MRIQDLIRQKRDGEVLAEDGIRTFIQGVADGSVPDYQAAALLMAIYLQGLRPGELSIWADAMLHSGRVMDLSAIAGVKVDKHSTGGVGDKVSICLAPLVAACGVPVPMISGRGLGHTGGTLDKLEAIPGFSTDQSPERFAALVDEVGLSLIGQTADLAPADKKLYALRDVTSTVESIPLIASSIMSKKLAEGIDALVLDVKVGSGAFMKDREHAKELAKTIIGIGQRAGKQVTAFITDMNQPLGREVGNASETREAIEILQGQGPEDLWQLTRALAVEMLLLGKVADDEASAGAAVDKARADGSALARLRRCVELQGGDPAVIDDPSKLPTADQQIDVKVDRDGVLTTIVTEQIGVAGMTLGAGRKRTDDVIDPGVGLTMHARLGQQLKAGDRLATLHHRDEAKAEEAAAIVRAACQLGDHPVDPPELILEVLR